MFKGTTAILYEIFSIQIFHKLLYRYVHKSQCKMPNWTVLTDFSEISYIEVHENTFGNSRFVLFCVQVERLRTRQKKYPPLALIEKRTSNDFQMTYPVHY
jgi:hypothetical protein